MNATILLMLTTTLLIGNTIWNYDVLASKGWKVTQICKNGYLTERLEAPNGGIIEVTYCYDKSSWNGGCNHPPVKCKDKQND